MLTITRTILFVICLTHLVVSDRYQETIFKKRIFLAEEVTASEKTNNGELLYAHCYDEKPILRRDITCIVHLESNTFEPVKSCNVSLKAGNEGTIIDRRKLIHHFGTNKALLVWLEKNKSLPADSHYLKITIINLDDCQTNVTEISFDGEIRNGLIEKVMGNQVLTYDDDTFDVIYQNSKVCKDKYCKVTFDSKGNQMKDPIAWLPTTYRLFFVVPVVPQSSAKGHLAAVYVNEGFNVTLINDDGLKELAQYPTHENIGFSYSNTHDTISFCHHNLNLKSNCTQYNHEGKIRLQTTFPQTHNYLAAGMYNLANGGFLLITAGCAPGDSNCLHYNPQYYVLKIAADGKKLKEIEFAGFECDRKDNLRPISQFFERKDSKVCLNLGCYEWKEPNDTTGIGRVHAVGKCFTDEDFSN